MRLGIWAAFGLAAVALAGCNGGGGGGGFSDRRSASTEGNVFRYPIITNPTSLDPGIVQDGDTLDVIQNVFEGLVGWSEDNEPVGLLAESIEPLDGGQKYRFTLKRGVKFHSGREVTANDFKWSIERNTNPSLASPTAEAYLSDIVGVTEKVNGQADEVSGYQVIDDYTIEISLKQPTPYFLGKLTYLVSAVIDKDAFDAEAEVNEPSKLVGTGPYTLDQYEPEQLVVLKAFEDYHGGAPELDAIHRVVVKDAIQRLQKYRNGELDMTMLQRQDIAGIQEDDDLKSHLKGFDRPAIWYIGMNQLAYAPFKDRRVRRAFAMAINKERIVEELMSGHNRVANSIVPPGVKGHQANADVIEYNPEEAKKLLAEAGYPNGEGLPPLELFFREDFPDIQLVAEAASSDLRNNLGVDAKLRTMEWRAYLEKYNAEELPFFHMRWAADFLDAQNFLSHMLATYGPENKIGYRNEEYTRLCREADTTLDWAAREPLYNQAENIVLQDAVWVPIYFQKDYELHSPQLKGMRESLFGHLPHTKTTLE